MSSKASTGRRGRTGAARRDRVPRAARHERVRLRAEGRCEAPRRLAHALRPRRDCEQFARACAARDRERRAVRLRDLARPRHHVRIGERPRDVAARSSRRCATRVSLVPVARSTTSRCKPGLAPGRRPRHLAARRAAGMRRSRCARRNTSARGPRRTSRSSVPGMPPRDRHHVDRADGVLAARSTPATRADGPRRSAAGASLVWDNYPVNDALDDTVAAPRPVRRAATPNSCEVVGGVLCNPMTQAHASLVPLATAMDFLRDPDGYDARRTRGRARSRTSAPIAPKPLAVLAARLLRQPDRRARGRSTCARRVDELEDELDGPGWIRAVAAVADELAGRARTARRVPRGRRRARPTEVAPWAFGARVEAEAGLAALRLIQQVRPVATVGERQGRAAAPDPEPAMHRRSPFLCLERRSCR